MTSRALPSGTVTFLFTDIEVSTDLWERHGDAMAAAVREHDDLIDAAVEARGGVVFKRLGDGAAAAFAVAEDAVAAAVDIQRGLEARRWPLVGALRARIGIHTGPAVPSAGDYLGPTLNRCARVMAAGHGGQVLCSEATRAVALRLDEGVALRDLGEHRLRGIHEPLRLHQVTAPGMADGFGPLRAEPAVAPPLRRARTSFVGREQELELLADLLRPGAVVTLTGMGGCGKTRLALEAAGAATGSGAHDRVHLVELAELTDGARVLHHVAAAAGAPVVPGADPVPAVRSVLGRGRPLVVLDNCEHLVDACAEVVEALTATSPGLAVLATSREPLGVLGERVVRVPSLSAEAAARLFVERAPAGADLEPSTVAAVCARLDGIPLAIELAAARLRHLRLDDIARRLDDRFRLLAGGARGGLRRQQTLRATLDWSHELLRPEDQTVLRRLAVFVGGFDLAAAERVCGGPGAQAEDVLDHLGALVDRSLVGFDDHTGRYSLLESVRDYGSEKLVEAGEAEAVRDRHLAWAVELLERHAVVEPDVVGGAPAPEVSRDFENLSAALAWAVDRGEVEAAYAMASRMLQGWVERGLFADADEALQTVFRLPAAPGRERERAAVAIALSEIAAVRGSFSQAWERAQTAIDLVEHEGPERMLSEAMRAGGIAASVSLDLPTALDMLRTAVEAAESTGNQPAAARALVSLASYVLGTGDLAEATALFERAAALYDDPRLDRGRVEAFSTLAVARVFNGDLDGARAALDRAGLDDASTLWWGGARFAASIVASAEGDRAAAHELLAQQLASTRALRVPLGESVVLVGLGTVEVLGGDPGLGARILGAARALYGRDGAWRGPVIGGIYVEATRRARELLGPERAKSERQAGLTLSVDDAVGLVLPAQHADGD